MLIQSKNNRILLSIAVLVFLSKLYIYVYMYGFKEFLFFGGDSDYYHSFAIGEISGEPANVWPVILKALNEIGMYSRDVVSYFMMSLSLIFIPLILSAIVWGISRSITLTVFIFLYSSIYPTQFLYSFDIYRDIFMIFVFLSSVYFLYIINLKVELEKKMLSSIALAVTITGLVLLRPYLGLSVLVALFYFVIFSNKKMFKWFFPLYVISVLGLFYFNFFDLLLTYRHSFSEMKGGSNLNLTMGGGGLISFSWLFIKSYFYQVFGVYIIDLKTSIIFTVESLPIVLSLFYVMANRAYVDRLAITLIVFFLVYNTVWVIGNDNFGTGMRLRIYSYYAMLICMVIVCKNKQNNKAISGV